MAQYELIIKSEESEGKGEPTNMAGMGEDPNENISKPTTSMAKITGLIAMNLAKELVVSKVGEVTRDSLLQRKIDTATGLVTTVGAFAVDPGLGLATAGIGIASQLIDYSVNMEKEMNRLAINRERAGYINRSRD